MPTRGGASTHSGDLREMRKLNVADSGESRAPDWTDLGADAQWVDS